MDPESGGVQETLIMVEFTCSAVKLVGELAPVHKKPFTVDKLLSNYFSKSDASTCLTLNTSHADELMTNSQNIAH